MSVKVSLIQNIFENEITVSNIHDAGKLKLLLQEFCLLHTKEFPNLAYIKVTVDVKFPDKDWEPVVPNDWNILIVPDESEIRIIPSIGDQKASGIISVVIGVAMIVGGIVVSMTPGPWQPAGPFLILSGMMTFAGGMIALTSRGISPLIAADIPKSNTYSFEDLPNPTDPSLPVPVIYGEHRVAPHLINAFLDHQLNIEWAQSWQSDACTTISQGSFINEFRTTYTDCYGIQFVLTNPTLRIDPVGDYWQYFYQNPCTFNIEYAKMGDSYTTYGSVYCPGSKGMMVVGQDAPTAIRMLIQIMDLPVGQYTFKITSVDAVSGTESTKYWSEVSASRPTGAITGEKDIQHYNLLYGVCEGEIESISNIEINGTPILDIKIEDRPTYWVRLGTNNQTVISGFNEVKNYKYYSDGGGQKLSQNSGVILTTDGDNVSALMVHVSSPALYTVDRSSGDLSQNSVTIRIEYRIAAGVWSSPWDITITSNTRSKIARYFRIPAGGYFDVAGQYQVRVTRLSQDNTDSAYQENDIYFMGAYEIQNADLAYPNTALLGMRIKASEQLSGSLPKVTCVVRGKKIYQLNSATTAISQNPINCLYDFITNARYSLGNFIDNSNINIEQWKTEETYCDNNDLKLDIVLDSVNPALDLITQMCTSFRGILVYSEGAINIIVDKATDIATQVFSMGNIIADSLVINYIDRTKLPNVLELSFANKERDWEMDVIQVRSPLVESSDTREIKKSVSLVGITRPSQIIAIGGYLYNFMYYVSKTISFKAMIDTVHCQPGDLIEFQHDVPDWGNGGRVVTATVNQVTLDKDVTIETGTDYVITTRLADDTVQTKAVDETTTTGGSYPWTGKVITMAESFSSAPPQYAPYAFGIVNAESVTYRITKISKSEDFNVAIEAIEFNGSIFNDAGLATPIPTPTRINDAFSPPPAVTNLVLKESQSEYGIIVSFTLPNPSNNFSRADIQISSDGGATYRSVTPIPGNNDYLIKDLLPGMEYYVRVVSYSSRGVPCKTPPSASIWLTGILFRPNNVYGLQIKGEGSSPYWNTKDCTFVWRWDANAGQQNYFSYFRVRILDTDDNLIREEQVEVREYSYTYEKNKLDNGQAISSFQIQVRAVNQMGHESPRSENMTVSNPSPVTPGGISASGTFRGVYFAWIQSWEPDHDHYSIRIKVASDDWSDWFSIETNFYTRVLSSTERDAHGVNALVYIEVKDVDAFGSSSATPASASTIAQGIVQVDMSGDIFQIAASDSDGNTTDNLKKLYDGNKLSDGIAYVVT